MPLFVILLLMWPLKFGHLHIVSCSVFSCCLVVYPVCVFICGQLIISVFVSDDELRQPRYKAQRRKCPAGTLIGNC